jgi:hypothetical protein
LPKVLANRIFFERVKTARRVLALHDDGHASLLELARRDLAVLARLAAGNNYWMGFVTRQLAAFERDGKSAAFSGRHGARTAGKRAADVAPSSALDAATASRLLGQL